MSEREVNKRYLANHSSVGSSTRGVNGRRHYSSTVGNNAVSLNHAYPLPVPEVEPKRRETPRRQPKPRQKQKVKDVYRTAPRRDVNYAKVNSLCTIVLAFVIIATLGILVVFLQSHFSVNETTQRIEQVKKDLNQVRRENIQMEEELDSLVDLEYVYEVATTRLGMRIPGENEVYHIDNNPVTYTTKYGPVEVVDGEKITIGKVWDYIIKDW